MLMEHIKALQTEIIYLVLALLASVLVISGSNIYLQSAEQQKRDATQSLNEARARYNLAKDRKKILEEFEQRYKKLESSGVVGDEDRLNWADLIENVTQKQGIPYVKYRIDKQEKLVDAGLNRKYPGITVFRSKMVLEMQLLHEGDMYSLINALGEKARGIFDVSECNFARINFNQASILEQPTDKNFNATC